MKRGRYVALLMFWAFLGFAADPDKLVDTAMKAYVARKYDVAVEKFIQILEMGYGGSHLYYNLGNAYYRLKDYPRAIWCYEKALTWDASFSDARYNYEFVQKQLFPDQVIKPPYLSTVIFSKVYEVMSWRAWTIISIVLFLLTAILFLLFFFSRNVLLRRWLFSGTVFLLFIWLIGLIMTGYGFRLIYHNPHAFVVDNTLVLRSEPADDAIAIGNVKPGLRVKVLKQKDAYFYVETPDGMKGWIKKGNLLLLKSIVPIPQ